MTKNIKFQNLKLKLTILLFSILILIFISFQGIYSNYSKYLDIDEMKKLKYIEAVYDIFGKNKDATETIKYFFSDTLYIEEKCEGNYGNGYYKISFDTYYRPLIMETLWISEVENADSFERFIYNYENATILYTNLKTSKSKTFNISEVTGDSVTLGELIVFINTEVLKNLSAGGLIVPNAYQAPFIFRYLKSDTYKLNNEIIKEEIYKAEINNPFLQFLASMFGNKAEIHLRSEFPHIRTRAFYSIRTVLLKDFKIITK